jgi:hypothetical protein
MLFALDHRGGKNGAKAPRRFREPRVYLIGQVLVAERKQVRGSVHEALCCSSRYALRNFQYSSKEISNR